MQLIKKYFLPLLLILALSDAYGQHVSNPYHVRTARNSSLIGLDTGSYLLTNTRFGKLFTDHKVITNDVQYVQRLKRLPGAFGIHLNQNNFFGHQGGLPNANLSTLNLTYNHILRQSEHLTWTAGLSFRQRMAIIEQTDSFEKMTHFDAQLPKINTAFRYKNWYGGLSLGFLGARFDQSKLVYLAQYELTMGYDFSIGPNFDFNLMAHHSMTQNHWENANSLTLKTTYKDRVWLALSVHGLQQYGASAGYRFKNGVELGLGYAHTGYLSPGNRSALGLQFKWNL